MEVISQGRDEVTVGEGAEWEKHAGENSSEHTTFKELSKVIGPSERSLGRSEIRR